jgi:hypothetical protein
MVLNPLVAQIPSTELSLHACLQYINAENKNINIWVKNRLLANSFSYCTTLY